MNIDSIHFGPSPETRPGCVLHDSGPPGGATGRQSKTSWPLKKLLAVVAALLHVVPFARHDVGATASTVHQHCYNAVVASDAGHHS